MNELLTAYICANLVISLVYAFYIHGDKKNLLLCFFKAAMLAVFGIFFIAIHMWYEKHQSSI